MWSFDVAACTQSLSLPFFCTYNFIFLEWALHVVYQIASTCLENYYQSAPRIGNLPPLTYASPMDAILYEAWFSFNAGFCWKPWALWNWVSVFLRLFPSSIEPKDVKCSEKDYRMTLIPRTIISPVPRCWILWIRLSFIDSKPELYFINQLKDPLKDSLCHGVVVVLRPSLGQIQVPSSLVEALKTY